LYSLLYGSFAREESCLILLYENNGFEVLIGHRLFNPNEKYGTRKGKESQSITDDSSMFQLPKKTPQFLKFWSSQSDNLNSFKLYERNMKLLKWRTLKGRASEKVQPSAAKVEVNPKILGIGP
jgi:hypothetical protein